MVAAARVKTVKMLTDYDYRLHPRRSVRFRAGTTYARVLELAARDIERHGAGRIVDLPPDDAAGPDVIDTRHLWTPDGTRKRRR